MEDPHAIERARQVVEMNVRRIVAEEVATKISSGVLDMSRYRLSIGVATLPQFAPAKRRRREEAEANGV